jgi:choice-of-anchor A domain-containing protein
MHSSSLCPAYEITVVAKYIFDKFNYAAAAASKNQIYNPYKMKNSEEWDRFISLGSSSTTFYFVGYLQAKTRIGFPLVPGIIGIRGYLEGFFVLPNPFKKGLKLHMELEIEATIHGFGVDLSWEVNDQETTWYCFAELFLVDIGIVLKGPSTWLEEQGIGSLLKIPKKFEKFSIRFGNSIKRLLQELNKYLKKIAEQLKEMWDGIKRAVENLHREIKNLTDKLCNCFVSDIAAGLLTVISAGWVAAGQLLLSLFGNTKTETRKIGETDPFKCDILEVKVKKCICAFGKCACTTIRTDKTVDQVCINRVQAIHLEAAYKEELANWKDDVVTVNMAENLGYQYILEQIDKNNLDFFTGEDIQLRDIIYEFPDLPKYERSFTSKFDPNNQSFVQDFENSFASLFPPISNIDEDLDLSQLYQNDQDLLIKTQLVINTTRLSSLFRGKDAEIFNLSLPLELDFKSGDLLEESFDKMFETLTDPNGELFKIIVGNNSGITEILLEAYGMTPPVISIKNKVNKTIHCDDPQIDDVFDQGEYKVTQRLKFFLTSITLEDIYKTCMSNITYIDNVECSIDKDVCGAQNCLFERYIFDGCKQISNTVYENIRILPRKPYFEEFPDNIPVKCDENINVTSTFIRFKQPKVNPGCRGLEYNLYYEDVLDEKKCEQKIYRKWHAETLDCEAELYALRVQQLYVEDRVAPYFSYFPADRNVEFFEAYGTRDLDYPRAYDSCGHGPSLITYNDTAIKTTSGKRVIERTWSVVDICGNKREKIQKIHFQNSRDNSQWDFRRYLTFSFGQLNLTNVYLMGEIGGRDKIKLNSSQIGHFSEKCSNLKFMLTSSDHIDLDDSIINGPVKTLNSLRSDFDFDESWRQAKKFSAFLNSTVFQINKGFNKIKCIENTPSLNEDYPIENFKESTCVGQESKKMYTNVIEHDDELVLDYLDRVLLKGDELIYNIFYFRDISLISNRILAIDVPIDSFAIINIDAHQVKSLNISKIEFVNEKMNPTNVLFNFLLADEIVYNDDCLNELVGSILAPYAIFEINGDNLDKKKTLNGQLFAKSLNAANFNQYCDLFELFF